MDINSVLPMRGSLKTKVFRAPRAPISWRLTNALRANYLKGWFGVHILAPIAKQFGLLVAYGTLSAVLIKSDGQKINYGVLSHHVVTTAFVNFLTDQLQTESTLIGDFKYHDSGVGSTAENISNTAIETTDGESRAVGTQAEAAANIYQSVATINYTTTKAITEHGIFNDPTAGTLLDRSVFAVINVNNGDAIQFTYNLTISAGG